MTNFLTYKEAISYDELYKAMIKCKRNVQWKDSVANFVLHSVKNISNLSEDLEKETYLQREPYMFKVTSPKPRDILSVPFRDRVYQRSLNDNILYPIMTRSFILDNCACQFNKGNQFARKRLIYQLRKMSDRYGTDLFVLKIDIHGFYKNLRHEYVEGLFEKKLDSETFRHVRSVISKQYQGEIGYNPGSQMIQIAGVSALDGLDHYIKEQLHVECYVHYMDDLIVVTRTKEHALECKEKIQKELSEIGLEYNRKKTNVFSVRDGIAFLGFKFLLMDSGKIIQLPLPSKIKNGKRKYRHMIQKSLPNGKVSISRIEESYKDFRENLKEGNSYKSINKLDKYYLDLWKGTENYGREIQFIQSLRKKKKRSK